MSLSGLARLTALTAAGALTAAAALESEHARAPLQVPGLGQPHFDVSVSNELRSKQVDEGVVIHDDAVDAVSASGRVFGIGAHATGVFALGQAPTPGKPGRKTGPGEFVQFDFQIDAAVELRQPAANGTIPLLQIVPRFTYTTYPIQPRNTMKDHQRWLGYDLWWMTPAEGLEAGLSMDRNVSNHFQAFKGGLGLREFFQAAPLDLAFYQFLNYGNKSYHQNVNGCNSRGFTTGDLGVKATFPLHWEGLWIYGKLDTQYWLEKDDRDALRLGGQDSGSVILAFGLDWRPD